MHAADSTFDAGFDYPLSILHAEDGTAGERIAIDNAGNLFTAESTVRGVTKYVEEAIMNYACSPKSVRAKCINARPHPPSSHQLLMHPEIEPAICINIRPDPPS